MLIYTAFTPSVTWSLSTQNKDASVFCLYFDGSYEDHDPRIDDALHRECFEAIEIGGYRLLWRDDPRLHIEQTSNRICILIDELSTGARKEYLQIDLGQGRVRAHRPWPGANSVYFRAKSDFLITTHLRLAAVFGATHRPVPRQVNAGETLIFKREGPRHALSKIEEFSLDEPPPLSVAAAVRRAKKELRKAMKGAPSDSAILLSGGIDSAAMAASAPTLPCLTWTTPKASKASLSVNDAAAARSVADFLSLSHEVVQLDGKALQADVDAAILLGETRRGTFVDDAVVYVQIARLMRERGVKALLIGEAADDVFGCLPYNLRYYQGDELLTKLRRSLKERAPADFAAMSRIFKHFGVAILDPYLSLPIARLGFSLPLEMRIDAARHMKPVLRKAFQQDLPREINQRIKRVSRDVSGVRDIIADSFGVGRERFLPIFNSLFRHSDALERQRTVLEAL